MRAASGDWRGVLLSFVECVALRCCVFVLVFDSGIGSAHAAPQLHLAQLSAPAALCAP
jgi:hypothetical protein